MIWRLLAKAAQKATEKAVKIRPEDIMTQQTADDIVQILKELIL